MIYDGDPVEALVYFKTETSQANAAESECPNCGNVETDDILHIVEVKLLIFWYRERETDKPD